MATNAKKNVLNLEQHMLDLEKLSESHSCRSIALELKVGKRNKKLKLEMESEFENDSSRSRKQLDTGCMFKIVIYSTENLHILIHTFNITREVLDILRILF